MPDSEDDDDDGMDSEADTIPTVRQSEDEAKASYRYTLCVHAITCVDFSLNGLMFCMFSGFGCLDITIVALLHRCRRWLLCQAEL